MLTSAHVMSQLSTILRRGGLKLQLVGAAGRRSKTGSSRNAADPYPVETGPTH